MKTELIHVIFEREVKTDKRHAVEWCTSYNEAKRRCDELDAEDAEYTHSFIQLPGKDK